MKRTLIVVLFQMMCFQNLKAQEFEYEIRLAGFQIGNLTVKKSLRDTLTYYELHSKVNFWLFVRVRVDYKVTAIYHKDMLISSIVTTRSSKGDFKSTTHWNNDHYIVHVNAYQYKKDTVIYEPINFNIGKLYFEKPEQGKAIYADNYGVITRARNGKSNEVIVSVMDNPNAYYYDKNLLVEVAMYNRIKDYQIKLKSKE